MASRQVLNKSVSGLFWSYASFFTTKALSLLAIVIVALYLSPAEFGLMAFSLVILGYFELLQGFGLAAFLISTQDDVEDAAHAVFAFAVTVSSALVAGLWLFADAIAAFLDQAELADVLRVLSVVLLIEAVAQVHNALLQRELKFRLKLIPEVGRGLVKGLLSIALAVSGFGVWSLVYGHLAGTLVWSAIVIAVRPWRPRRLPSRAALGRAVRYGSNIVAGELCNVVPKSLDQVLIGKVLGAAPLGLYALAQRMPDLVLRAVGFEAFKVVHPIMSQMQADPAAIRSYYYGLVRYLSLIMFAAGAVLVTITPPLIHVLYAPEWHGMIVPMQIMSAAFALSIINHLPGVVYKAINRSDLFLYIALINLPFSVGAFWFSVSYGIEAVAMAHLALVVVLYTPHFFMLRRAIGVEALPTVRAAIPGLVCAGAAALAGLLARQAVQEPGMAQLAATLLGAAAGYLLALWRLGPEIFVEARRMIDARITRLRGGRP